MTTPLRDVTDTENPSRHQPRLTCSDGTTGDAGLS